jgi:predicted nucleic acid-binding Zn ribbon protein
MGRGKSEPVRVSAVLPRVLRDLGLDAAHAAMTLQARWPEIVGEDVAAHSTPDVLRGRTLDVGVDSPAWSHALTLRREELLARLRAALGDEAPLELRFRLGRAR